MLSISLVQGDGSYYTAGGEPARWWGDAVPLLGLPRTVDPDRFKNLLKGLTPDGNHRLLPPHPRRDAGWDLTFSAPKSVSVLRAFVDEKTRARIDACHEGAVAAALRLVQSQAGFTRRGQGGTTREPAAMLFMLLKHEVSRDFDPQLHTHAVAINLAVREDRTCGAIHSVLLYRVKMLAGAVYQAELAHSLARNLGLQIETTRVAFRIRGVPRELCRAFSKRRIAVEAKLNDQSTARDAQKATQHTRPAKAAFDLHALRQKWEKEAGAFLWGREQAEKLLGSGASKEQDIIRAERTASKGTASESASRSSAKSEAEPQMSRLHGDAVALLGLPREVGPDVFTHLSNGKSPDGKTQLVPPQRLRDMVQPLSFTIPKSLSVVRVLASDENRRGIDEAHNAAVTMALRYLQTQAGFTLSNQVGPSVQPAALIFKLSTHELTEDMRPLLVTHALPINLAVRADRTCGPVLHEFFDRARHIAQAIYLTELAKRLNIDLGLEVVSTFDGFHVRGVPEKLCNALLKEGVVPSSGTKANNAALVADAPPPPGTLFASGEKLFAGLRRGWEQTAARYSWSRADADQMINRHIYREPDLEGFYRRLADDVRHLPVSRRTADSTINLARRLALESSVGGVQMLRAMGQIKEYREPLYHVRWLRMFPKAPFWSLASLIKKPVIHAGGRPRHWGKVIRRKEIMNLEVRLQMRRLFPRLPAWHPASKLQLPAIRVAIPEARQRYIIQPEHGL